MLKKSAQQKQNKWQWCLLLLLPVISILLYFPGITGTFYYDDIRPLGNLTHVTDLNSAFIYIFSETSGMLGRSVSMFTFLLHSPLLQNTLLQGNDWFFANTQGSPSAFFIFNITLHAVNSLLVFALTYFISHLYHGKGSRNFWFALATSAFWLVLPIHVSTSLIAIQRMAGLSAFFVFFGLFIYVYGLYKQSITHTTKNKDGLALQLTGLILFTVLAMFSKENGVLLPIFVLVLELTLLSQVSGLQRRRKLRIIACLTGLIALLAYMGYLAFHGGNILPGREFTLVERILTQPQILQDYLTLAFFPDVAAFNPFHDNYVIIKHFFDAPVAWFLLIGSFIGAVLFRRKYPLFSFAVLWFLTAHLLESSIIGLELYFEHRNYVALLGACLALVFSFANIATQYKKLALIAALLYWCVLAFSLYLTTSLWGNQELAAQSWYLKQQGSERAAEHFSIIEFNKQKPLNALKITTNQLQYCSKHSSCANTHVKAMLYTCFLQKEKQTQWHYQQASALIAETKKTNPVALTIGKVKELISNRPCKNLTVEDLKKLNHDFLALADFTSPFNQRQPFLQNLYLIALDERNRAEAIRLLYLAWFEQPELAIANELIRMLIADKQMTKARVFVDNELCKQPPWNPIFAQAQLKACNELQQLVLFAESSNKP